MEVWSRLAAGLGIKETGLTRLSHDVRTCEYEDVRVLWEMLNKEEAEITAGSPPAKKGEKRRKGKNVCSSFLQWACRRI